MYYQVASWSRVGLCLDGLKICNNECLATKVHKENINFLLIDYLVLAHFQRWACDRGVLDTLCS